MSDHGILVGAQGVIKAAVQHLFPQSAGFAITSDLARVACAPSRMASCFTSNAPARGRPMGAPLLCSDPFALSEVQPCSVHNRELWDESEAAG